MLLDLRGLVPVIDEAGSRRAEFPMFSATYPKLNGESLTRKRRADYIYVATSGGGRLCLNHPAGRSPANGFCDSDAWVRGSSRNPDRLHLQGWSDQVAR